MSLSHQSRSTPAGKLLKDGYQTLIAMSLDADISFWEKTVQPPGLDGGDEIDITTMHNDTLRTRAPRSLATMTNMQSTVAYDPRLFDQILAVLNVEQTFTVIFPNGDKLSFYGFLKNFEPQEVSEGEQPEANITIVPTNRDPDTGAETNYLYTELHTGT